MKIAYVVPYVPNLIRTRSYNLIARLAALGHDVEVFTLGSNRRELLEAEALKSKCSGVRYHLQPTWQSFLSSAVAVPSRQPLQSVYSWQTGMARKLAAAVSREKFDVVHVEHLRGSRYGLFVKARSPTTPVVWDSVDCISHLYAQAADQSRSLFGKAMTRFELPRTRTAESRLICSFDRVLVTSSTERTALLKLAPEGGRPSPISVLPNGVDLDYFHPSSDFIRDDLSIVFSGKMSYHANITMVKYLVAEIMPRIWKRQPAARLYIVGKDPTPEIKVLSASPRITVTGTVDDIRPFLWRATVSVVPLIYGAGIQNKILEAMAAGTPVVTTSKALSALQVRPGRELLASDDPDEFAQAVLKIMEDPSLQAQLRVAGLAYVKAFHNWNRIASQLADIYQRSRNSGKGSVDG